MVLPKKVGGQSGPLQSYPRRVNKRRAFISPNDESMAVMFDLVQPLDVGRDGGRAGRDAGLKDAAGHDRRLSVLGLRSQLRGRCPK
jgi:hypothetical protein